MIKKKSRWETRQLECPEEERPAVLLVQWYDGNGKDILSAIYCDNPRFGDLDNWDCDWSCWEMIEGNGEDESL